MIRVSDEIRGLAPYVPGKPIEEVERELGLRGVVKLASNENALGASPRALAAIRRASRRLHRYPDGAGRELRRALAKRFGFGPGQIALGNGSNELIELLSRTLLSPGDEAVMARPTFPLYRIQTIASRGRAVEVPLAEHVHDLDAIAKAVGPRTRLVFICNPNNPTGTIVERAAVERFLGAIPAEVLVVFDEAYREYADESRMPDTPRYLREGRNIIVLRTFSKIYGLAALRIGYGIAAPDLVEYLNRVRQPFNTNLLAQEAALAALGDRAHVRRSLAVVREGKKAIAAALDRVGLRHIPSEANFIFFHAGEKARPLCDAVLRRGVILRDLGEGWLRVTIGRPAENRKFIRALEAWTRRRNDR